MLERKTYQDLLKWKAKKGRTALLIEGARRVGKSTLIREFGRKEYRSMLYIDCSRLAEPVRQYFLDNRNRLESLQQFLAAVYDVTLYPRESLIVFDEVQQFPPAREMMKHFVADGKYDYIESGSLLSIKQNVADIVLPSEEESLRLNPLDFEEFLWAVGERPLAEFIRSSFTTEAPLPQALHRKATYSFREYLLVGGMPSVVSRYLENRSFAEADEEKRQILKLYRDDIGRFAFGYKDKVTSIFDEIPEQLAKHEKRFNLASLGKDARLRTYEEAFFWLSDAEITNPCWAADDPSVGLSLSRSSSSLKCYMADTGLLVTMALADSRVTQENIYQAVLLGRVGLNEGMLTENMVAQTLMAKGDRLFFYNRSGKEGNNERMEIDFLVIRPWNKGGDKPRVTPIEVKSGARYSTLSLDRFREKFSRRTGTAYVVHPGQYKKEEDLVHVPLYMAHCL